MSPYQQLPKADTASDYFNASPCSSIQTKHKIEQLLANFRQRSCREDHLLPAGEHLKAALLLKRHTWRLIHPELIESPTDNQELITPSHLKCHIGLACPTRPAYSRILRHELPLPIVEGLLDSCPDLRASASGSAAPPTAQQYDVPSLCRRHLFPELPHWSMIESDVGGLQHTLHLQASVCSFSTKAEMSSRSSRPTSEGSNDIVASALAPGFNAVC